MSTKIWKVDRMVVTANATHQNVVSSVDWTILGSTTVDGNTYNTAYSSSTSVSDTHMVFVEYPNITEEIALTWVKDDMGVDAVALAESQIDLQLDVVINAIPYATEEPPTEIMPLPWE